MTKEEYSEYAYKQMIDETWLDENGEFEAYGHHYRGADDWEQSDNPAFREGYNAWLDGLEKDGIDTGVNESYSSESYWGNQGQYQDLYNKYHSEIPDEGSVNDSLLEQLRIVSNVYYDVGNNGGGNLISGMGSAGEHGKINGFIPETIMLVNRTEQTENSGGLEYDEEQRLIQASLQELDEIVDNLLQQIKNDRADKEEQSNYWGEAKANETFYEQAKWLAKAKLEAGGLDIVNALPDIIRNTRTSTGRDMDEDELSRAIEDAIAEYKESISTGMSMWGNKTLKISETEPKLDTEEDIDDYIKEGTDPAPYEEEEMPETVKQEIKDKAKERSKKSQIDTMMDLGAGDLEGMIPDGISVRDYLEDVISDDGEKDEAEEIIGALAINSELEGIKDTYGSSANADPTTQPLEDYSGNDDSSDAQTDISDDQGASDVQEDVVTEAEDEEPIDNDDEMKDGWRYEDTVEESFGDCGCKDTKKAKMTWETATESDKQYWLRDISEDEGYSYYYFEHLPKRIGESLVNKFKVDESEDRGWSKIPALERADLLKKLGFPPRDAELVANLEYPQLSESLKKDVNDAVSVKKRAEESQKEKPDEQLSFENDLYSNMYDGYLKRRGQRVESKKNDKF